MEGASTRHQKKFLIADTDQADLVRIKDGLKGRGFDIKTAIDGSRALELALTTQPDLIVLGLELPTIRTKQLMDILSVNPKTKGIPVLLMAVKPVQIKKLGLEPTDHLVKPVHVEALLERLYRLYNRIEQVKEETTGKAKEFEGNLSQIPITDLLQILNINKKDGSVQLESGQMKGFIYLQNGQVINASLGKLEGEKAFYRLLGWNDGKFEYTPDKAL